MTFWHAQVFIHGNVHEDDFAALEAAKEWAEGVIRERDPGVIVHWRTSGVLHETGRSPDCQARVYPRD